MSKSKHYDIGDILKENADYNGIIGVRSNGKTFSLKYMSLFGYHKNGINYNGYLDNGQKTALIRRFEDNFKGKYGNKMFDDIINNEEKGNILFKESKGRWNYIQYYNMSWYLANIEDGKIIERDTQPFCTGFGLNAEEKYKSVPYPDYKTIWLEEFLSRSYYLPDEFVIFESLISTIIRDVGDVKIFMLGNTINKYCPYFEEMGLYNIKNQKFDTIDVYNYGESGLKVAIELCGTNEKEKRKKKASDKYFAFNNPKLQMVTTGAWEIKLYPHLPCKYTTSEVKYFFFIEFNNEMLRCDVVKTKKLKFVFIMKKTTPIKEGDYKHIVYSTIDCAKPNYRKKITRPMSDKENMLLDFFKKDKVFYQTNDVGEIVRNYLLWCKTTSITD